MLESTPGLTASIWTPFSVATVVLGLRLFTRAKLHNLGLEDALVTLAWIAALITGALGEVDITSTTQAQASRAYRVAEITGVLSLFLGKSSVIFLLLRLIGRASQWRRWFLHIALATLVLLSTVCLILSIVQDCGSAARYPEEACTISVSVANGFVTTWNVYGVFLDFALSALPMTFVYRLQMPRCKRVGVSVLLGLGWIAGIFTILRAVAGLKCRYDDIGRREGWLAIFWLATALEIPLVIICGSAPTLMPLFEYWFNGTPMVSRSKSAPNVEPAVSRAKMTSKGRGPVDVEDGVERRHAERRSRHGLAQVASMDRRLSITLEEDF